MSEKPMSRNYFTRELDKNQKIDERFRGLMHDTFDGLYVAMGKKNFLRWINARKISDRIKDLIVEEFSEEDLEKYPNWVGYYTRSTNKENLRYGHINQNVASHETLHFFTDDFFGGKNFPIFLNEGLTEYLNREFEKINQGNENVRYTYVQNVDFIELLHGIMGDSLIKAYLTSGSKNFAEEFSTYITEDGKVNTGELDTFYNLLNRVHEGVLHPRSNPQTPEEQENIQATKKNIIENDYPKLRAFVMNIVVNAIRKKAHDLEYYEEGKFNIDIAIEDINNLMETTIKLLSKNGTFGISNLLSQDKMDFQNGILKNTLMAVLQESHIPNEKIEDIVKSSIDNGVITIQGNVTSARPPRINNHCGELVGDLSNNNVLKDLIDKKLGDISAYMDNGQFNITAFLMDASLIFDKMNVAPDLRQVYLDSAIFRYLPQDMNFDLVKSMIDKHSKLYVALYQKQQDNKRNVTDSKFIKISDTKSIEKRDNKIFFLAYDEETGTFSERQIIGEYTDQKMGFSNDVVDKFGGTVKRMTYIDRDNGKSVQYSIMFNEDFSTVTVNSKPYDVISTVGKLGDSFLIDEAMTPVLEGINNNKYVSILNDGEELPRGASYTWIIPDTRSRVINYELFLEELRTSTSNIPKELQKDIEKNMISNLISKTYLVEMENAEELKRYISNISLDSITNDKVVDNLFNFTKRLNQSRREYVEKESQHTGIHFANDEDRNQWAQSLKTKEEQKRRIEFVQDINAFIATDSVACITESLELRTDEEHYSTMEGVRYVEKQRAQYRTPVAGKVDYTAFCDRLKMVLPGVEVTKRSEFINRVINNSIDLWYGCGTGYPGEEDILDKRFELSDELVEILTNIINNTAEVNMTRVGEIEESFLALSKEEEQICKEILEKRNPMSFETRDVRKEYENIKSINGMDSIPEVTRKMIIKELKDTSKENLTAQRSIDAFAKLALSGKNVPTPDDVKKASRYLDFCKDKESIGRC